MKLKKDEKIIKEYFFKKGKESFSKAVLTDNRLIFIADNSEENYPLSKITSVKTEKKDNGFRSKVLGFSIIALIILLIITGVMIFGENNPNWDGIAILVPIYLIFIWLIRFGLKPDKVITNLIITQLGGTKRCTSTNNKNLQEFIDKINESLI